MTSLLKRFSKPCNYDVPYFLPALRPLPNTYSIQPTSSTFASTSADLSSAPLNNELFLNFPSHPLPTTMYSGGCVSTGCTFQVLLRAPPLLQGLDPGR